MAIDYVKSVFENSNYQLANLWEFIIDDFSDIQFHVVSASVPQLGLTVEERNTGEKFYSGYEAEGQFSIEVKETTDFKVYDYFKGWMNQVFDPERRVFRVNPPVKNASLVYTGFEPDGTVPIEFIVKEVTAALNLNILTRKEIETRVIQGFAGQRRDVITNKEIIYTVFSALQQRAVNAVNNLRSFTNAERIQPDLPVREQRELISSINVPKRRDEIVRRILQSVNQRRYQERIETFRETENKVFNFQNVRVISIDDLSPSYGDADPLTLTINMIADQITEEGQEPPVTEET